MRFHNAKALEKAENCLKEAEALRFCAAEGTSLGAMQDAIDSVVAAKERLTEIQNEIRDFESQLSSAKAPFIIKTKSPRKNSPELLL